MAQVELLGKVLQASVEAGVENVVDKVLPVIQGAVDVLNAQFANGQLSQVDIDYVGALNGRGVALRRHRRHRRR